MQKGELQWSECGRSQAKIGLGALAVATIALVAQLGVWRLIGWGLG